MNGPNSKTDSADEANMLELVSSRVPFAATDFRKGCSNWNIAFSVATLEQARIID